MAEAYEQGYSRLHDLAEANKRGLLNEQQAADFNAGVDSGYWLANGDEVENHWNPQESEKTYSVAQKVVGAAEVAAQMTSGFLIGAPSGTLSGVVEAVSEGDVFAYTDKFNEVAEKRTYSPRSEAGQEYSGIISGAYQEYMEEGLHRNLRDSVENGSMSVAEATARRVAWEGLLLAVPLGGSKALGAGVKGVKRQRNLKTQAKQWDEVVEVQAKQSADKPRIKISSNEKPRVRVLNNAVAEGAKAGLNGKQMAKAAEKARNIQEAVELINAEASSVGKVGLPRNVEALAGQIVSGGQAFMKSFTNKHISAIRNIRSPTAKNLADSILADNGTGKITGPDYYQLTSIKKGEFSTRINGILEPMRAHAPSIKDLRVIALPKRIGTEIWRGLETGSTKAESVPAVKAIRAILDDMHKYAVDAGLKINRVENFFPRVYDTAKIARAEFGKKNGGAFTRDLMTQTIDGMEQAAARDTVRKIIHEDGLPDFAPETGQRLNQGTNYSDWSRTAGVEGGPAKATFEKSRALEFKSGSMEKWLITDVEAVLSRYSNRLVERAEMARIAGQGEGKLNQAVKKVIDEARINGENRMPHEIAKDIYDLVDAVQHKYGFVNNDFWRGAFRTTNAIMTVEHLGLVALAQMPEFMTPMSMYRVRPQAYLKGLLQGAQDAASAADSLLTGKRHIPKSTATQHLERLGVISIDAFESAIAGRFSSTTGKFTNRFIKATGMEYVTNVQRLIMADTLNRVFRENAKALSKGKSRDAKIRMMEGEFRELGIEPTDAIEWYKSGYQSGTPFDAQLDMAIIRGTNNGIIMANAANRPRILNNQAFAPVFLFKSFLSAFSNTVIKRYIQRMTGDDWTNQRKIASTGAMLGSIGIAYYTQFLREHIKGYSFRDKNDTQRWFDAADRAGLMGPFTYAYATFSPYRFGYTDNSASRFFNLAGPMVGALAKGSDAVLWGDDKKKAKFAAKYTPIMNTNKWTKEMVEEFYKDNVF